MATVAAMWASTGCTIIGDLGLDSASAGGSGGASEGGGSDDDGIDTALPHLPELTNVRVRIVGDAANVSFDPVDAAVDYRVYPLPPDDDIAIGDDGVVVVDRALYRCAGLREALYMVEDIVNPDPGWNDAAAGGVTLRNHDVLGYTRSDDDAVLGHVFATEADGRVAVYALADPDVEANGAVGCGRPEFAGSRAKVYTTDPARRAALVAQHWRDDGIAFWVPVSGTADTHRVYEGSFGDPPAALRWIDGDEATVRGPGTALFDVLDAPTPGSLPLVRTHVQPYCGHAHDELVAGSARAAQVRSQGDQPLPRVRWSGLTEPTILVVEALDQGCPYQGNLSPTDEAPFVEGGFDYEGYTTPATMRMRSPTGEVFVNGQYDDPPPARAIARSFVTVSPQLPALDVFATFPTDAEFGASFGDAVGSVYAQTFTGAEFSLSSYGASHVHFGSMLGELWLAYNDIEAGVNSSVRLTANTTATVDDTSFLHVLTEVDLVSTDRRYPQILISDQPAPVQDNLAQGTTLLVELWNYSLTWPHVEICDHQGWDVGAPCPGLPVLPRGFAPTIAPPAETAGSDAATRIDLYLSSTRLYLLVDGAPAGCVDLPAQADDGSSHAPPTGEVTITWGDVLAHSAIDFATGGGPLAGNTFTFHRAHMARTTRRHFDNLGFASGVAAPAWDEAAIPCN